MKVIMRKNVIKLFDPFIDSKEEYAVKKVLKSRNWASGSGTGTVLKFEKEFTNYIGSNNCVTVNSGTAALHLALSLLDLKNKEVILPSISFVATAHAVVYGGGKPVFADVEQDTLCIDPRSIEQLVSQKTTAIIPVHMGGLACDLDRINKICREHDLKLIDDAAHAAGTTYKNKKIGSIGEATCFSFHPVKNLAMPAGGCITLNGKKNKLNEQIIKVRRWCGITNRNGPKYDVVDLGWNYYMNEFSAAIGLVQLKKLDKIISIKKKIAKRYDQEIKYNDKMPYDNGCSYHLYWIKVKNREKFMRIMQENKIETGIHYKPIYQMKFYNKERGLKNTELIANHIVSIPIHANLTESDVSRIIKITNKYYD